MIKSFVNDEFAPQTIPSGKEQITIMRYHTGQASTKNRITLERNLFSFLLAGEKTVHYAGTKVKIQPHQFLLLSAGNCLMTEKTAAADSRYESILCFFDNDVLAEFFVRHSRLLDTKTTIPEEDPVVLFEKDDFLFNYIDSLGHMLASGDALSPNMARVKLEELLLYLSERYPGKVQQLRTVSQQTADEAIIRQAVNTWLENQMSVEELAFLCHTSLSTFKRRFARIYGTSPNRWLLEKKMQRAAALLKQGDYNASDIYYDLGYENLSSFIQSFKQIHGITPKQYQLSN